MIIKVLTENTALDSTFECEHGLSLYIETKNHRILFDMGQTDLFSRNAEALGVDLKEVDIAFLSHGHYDHSGGLEKFLAINEKAKVYLSRFAFGEYYNGTEKFIGVSKNLLNNPRLIFVGDEMKIDAELQLFSLNSEIPEEKVESFGLNENTDGDFVPDSFRHEHYLVINENDKKTVISGCSHKGVINIAESLKPDVLVGGFHYSKIDPSDPVLKQRAQKLLSFGGEYYTCHCTGIEQYEEMKKYMGERLHYISAGSQIRSIL